MTANAPYLLADLADQTTAIAQRHGLSAEAADKLANELVEHLRLHWGGSPLYIPRGVSLATQRRNAKIWERWNGRNVDELCQEFDITSQRLYQILKQQRQGYISRVQGDLDL